MIEALLNFFGVIGLDITPPDTMSALIPYLFMLLLGMAVVLFIFRMFRGFANSIFGGRLL